MSLVTQISIKHIYQNKKHKYKTIIDVNKIDCNKLIQLMIRIILMH